MAKKSQKQILFERMHSVGGMPLNENLPWGAEHEPDAPWNEPDVPQDEFDGPDPDERHDRNYGDMKEDLDQPVDEFIPHGTYTVSNSGGYEIMLDDSGDAAMVRDAFGSDNPKTSDWLPIEYVPGEDGESEPVIDPEGYNIPLNQVMRLQEVDDYHTNSVDGARGFAQSHAEREHHDNYDGDDYDGEEEDSPEEEARWEKEIEKHNEMMRSGWGRKTNENDDFLETVRQKISEYDDDNEFDRAHQGENDVDARLSFFMSDDPEFQSTTERTGSNSFEGTITYQSRDGQEEHYFWDYKPALNKVVRLWNLDSKNWEKNTLINSFPLEMWEYTKEDDILAIGQDIKNVLIQNSEPEDLDEIGLWENKKSSKQILFERMNKVAGMPLND